MSKAPTILTEVVESDPIMRQDICGPVLPVLTVNGADEAIGFINRQEKPLCVYVYSDNSKVRRRTPRSVLCVYPTGRHASIV